jgi:hypothetical protein
LEIANLIVGKKRERENACFAYEGLVVARGGGGALDKKMTRLGRRARVL